jgi:GntR family transcriptional repressor for pyruvate dehydrogenase complex
MNASIPLDFKPLRQERAYQAVAQAIETKILTSEWALGSALPGEVALAEAFGVNRSTVREAIRVLEQQGLLVRSSRKQLVVNAPGNTHVASRMTAAIILQEVTFLEMWEVMMLTEPRAAEAAATRASDEEIAEIEQAHINSRLALGDPKVLVVWDARFLDAIAQASHNRVLQLCRAPLGPLFYPTFLPVLERSVGGKRLVQAQAEILKVLKAHDARGAFDWMRRHIEDFRRGYEAAGMDVSRPVAHQFVQNEDQSAQRNRA